MTKTNKIFFGAAAVILFLAFRGANPANGAGQQILITWQANSYAPSSYQGKVLPSGGSLLSAAVELLNNGRISSLAGQRIFWYVNDGFAGSGQKISFHVPANSAGGAIDLRVELPDSKLLKTISIPVSRPIAVIESPFPGRKFSSQNIELKARPYFFNTASPSALGYSWSVNGQKASSTENSAVLDVNVQPGTARGFSLNVNLSIGDLKNFLNSASDNLTLTYLP